jgi:Ca2+-binding EF-hand superfamily protein
MKKLRICMVTLAFCGASSPAVANDDHGDMMKTMDSNGDGAVSADEHAAGAKTMFDRMDANKDGVVTAQEMEKAHPQGDKKMSASDKIKTIDTNGDGQLSAAEHAAGSAAMFDKMDTDHNGSLSAGEWKAGHAPLMEKKSQ